MIEEVNLHGFGFKCLRILKPIAVLKGQLIILYTVRPRCLNQGLSSDYTFGRLTKLVAHPIYYCWKKLSI
jgi:hypothetical protein